VVSKNSEPLQFDGKPRATSANTGGDDQCVKPFFSFFFTGLSGLVTALSPIVLALIERRKSKLDPGAPPTERDSREYARSQVVPSPEIPEIERDAKIAKLAEKDLQQRRNEYSERSFTYKKWARQAFLMEAVVILLAACFFAYLALLFIEKLFIFICAYTLVIGIAGVCYADAKKLIGEIGHRTTVGELEIKALEIRQAHEMDMARLRFEQRMALLDIRKVPKNDGPTASV